MPEDNFADGLEIRVNLVNAASVRARTAVINVKRASVLDLISQATYIRSEKFKKRTPPNMARVSQIENVVMNELKAHQTPPEGLE